MKQKNTEFIDLDMRYLSQAVELSFEAYSNELKHTPSLYDKDYKQELIVLLQEIFMNGFGMMAIENFKLIGYIAFWTPLKNMFGHVNGAYSPVYANGFTGDERGKVASLLFEKISKTLLDKEVLQYGLAFYAHDRELLETFSLNGFGYRCADGIRSIANHKSNSVTDAFLYEEISYKDSDEILPLKNMLARHMGSSPTYFPIKEESLESFRDHVEESRPKFFVARDQGEVIGYLEVTDVGETFITEESDYKHICGAYLLETYRGKHVLKNLLEVAAFSVSQDDNTRLGVDCETLNPSAFRFWRKHFDIYTYSLVRRLDERILL